MAEAVTIARPYAVAVFRLAKEKKALAKWSEMLALVAAVAADERMRKLIEDPNQTSVFVEQTFLSVCANKLDATGENLVRLLVENDRLTVMPEIVSIFETLRADDEGRLDAEIIAATKLNDSQVKKLVAQLQTRLDKKIEAQVSVEPEIIGGIKIIVGDMVIDATVRGRLQELANTLKA
jgi:F-type H+-transporting ATPase subunit delta